MAKPRGRKPTQNQTAALLATALDFLSVIPDRKDNPNAVTFNGQIMSVNNGLLKASVRLGDDFPADTLAKVNMKSLIGALARVGKELTLSFTEEAISIEAGTFKAELPNLDLDPINDRLTPDPYIAPLNNEFRVALNKVAGLVSDSGDELLVSSIAVLGPTVMATKRHTIIEAWHGNDMPSRMIFLPKAFATALNAVKANVTGFGFAPKSFTAHFDNGAFLQTNTYDNAWEVDTKEPGFMFGVAEKLLTDAEGTLMPNDAVLALTQAIDAVRAVTPVDVWISLGMVESADHMVELAVKELVPEFGMSTDWYKAIAPLIVTAKIVTGSSPRMLFWGDKVRGVMSIDNEQPEPDRVVPGAPPVATGPAWAAPSAAPVADPTLAAAAGWGTPPTSAPAATPASTSPALGSGPTVPPTAFPSSTGASLFDD